MPQINKLVGGAGTGKTTELLLSMSKVAASGIEPTDIGFVSFTRAARSEASSRAAAQFGIAAHVLEQDGWFKTLHSICYRCLEVDSKQLITSDKASCDWLTNALQEKVSTQGSIDDIAEATFSGSSDATVILNLWSASRSKLEPFEPTWAEARRCNPKTPSLAKCEAIVENYERHKNLDNRFDFTDLLLRFAGRRVTFTDVENVEPQGDVPRVSVWYFDEQQDVSPLLHVVCERLIEPCRMAVMVGDPFQSIYGFTGADHSCFMDMTVDATKTMPKSYRCPPIISQLGERILRRTGDYYDRGIAPADHRGTIDKTHHLGGVAQHVKAGESWLLLARTNQLVHRFGGLLDTQKIPWRPTKGSGGYSAPAKLELIEGLDALRTGRPLVEDQIKRLFKETPPKHDGVELILRGVKSKILANGLPESVKTQLDNLVDTDQLLHSLGFTEEYFKRVWQGDVGFYKKDFSKFWDAYRKHGINAVRRPTIQVGTIHSAKGMEADNVALLTTIPQPVLRAQAHKKGFDEERRVEYVACTRARKRLLIVDEHNKRFKMRL